MRRLLRRGVEGDGVSRNPWLDHEVGIREEEYMMSVRTRMLLFRYTTGMEEVFTDGACTSCIRTTEWRGLSRCRLLVNTVEMEELLLKRRGVYWLFSLPFSLRNSTAVAKRTASVKALTPCFMRKKL